MITLISSCVYCKLARHPSRYVWEKVTIGGVNGFSVKDPAVVPRMAKWANEAEPWLHSYAQCVTPPSHIPRL
jgi:hypothetical protein